MLRNTANNTGSSHTNSRSNGNNVNLQQQQQHSQQRLPQHRELHTHQPADIAATTTLFNHALSSLKELKAHVLATQLVGEAVHACETTHLQQVADQRQAAIACLQGKLEQACREIEEDERHLETGEKGEAAQQTMAENARLQEELNRLIAENRNLLAEEAKALEMRRTQPSAVNMWVFVVSFSCQREKVLVCVLSVR